MEKYLRKATAQDKKLLFEWANDTETRKNSFNTEPIKWEDHEKWFDKKMSDEKCQIFIYMDFFVPVGVVRIDEEDDKTGVISYSIAPSQRGNGYGRQMLASLEKKYQKLKGSSYKLKAEVKEDNEKSKKIFNGLGYAKCGDGVFEKTLDGPTAFAFKKNRETGLEVLRVLAMMMVITLHYLQKGDLLGNPASDMSSGNMLMWLLESLCLCCVNVYVLISGYFLVDKKFNISRIVRMWGQVFFYSVGITVVMLALGFTKLSDISNLYDLYFLVFPVTGFHYWFATGYIFMLIFAPVLAAGIKMLDKKQLQLVIIFLLAVFSFLKTLLPFELQYDDQGYGIIWFIILFIIAAYFKLYGQDFIKTKGGAFACYILCSLGIWVYIMSVAILYRMTGKFDYLMSVATHYNFVLVLGASVGLFFLFKKMENKNNPVLAFIKRIAPYTFGVYLIHEHILVAHKWEDWLAVRQPYGAFRIVHILLTVLIIFGAGVIVDMLRSLLFKGISKLANLCLIIYYAKKEVWDYLIFGVLTTIVNWIAYAVASRVYLPFFMEDDGIIIQSISNVIAWIAAVAFAYWTNRCFVFKSENNGFSAVMKEMVAFVGARLFSFGVEQVLFMIALKVINLNDLIIKFLVGFVVIVLNYFFSKLLVFKNQKK